MMAGNYREVEKKEEAVFKKTFIRLERFIVTSVIVSGIVLMAAVEFTNLLLPRKKITKKLKSFFDKTGRNVNAEES